MADNFKAIIYPVKDLENAKTLFTALLGAPQDQDAPYYVGWSIEGQNIGLNPHGFDQGMTGPVPYVDVADIQARLDALVAAGASRRAAAHGRRRRRADRHPQGRRREHHRPARTARRSAMMAVNRHQEDACPTP